MDWIQARYSVEISARREPAVIRHRLENGPELDRLISAGFAEWVTELRCPRTLVSRQVLTRESEQAMKLDANDIVGDAFLIPGLVAIRDVELDSSGLNRFVWPDDQCVRVPAGWWLARGDARTTKPLTASLVQFRRDPDGRLDPGQMSVEEDSDGGLPYFRVLLAQDLYERRDDRDVQIAGLIGACARLPRSSMRYGGENVTNSVAQQLLARFEDAGIPNWMDDDDFDAARAATVLEAFYEPVREEED